ncbi:hypothetical protein B0H12DRAFT_1225349 [Mycena haematopus]|nr:hypothetical protein B0H12DRAFT_1225349 [Mycena haematopus]
MSPRPTMPTAADARFVTYSSTIPSHIIYGLINPIPQFGSWCLRIPTAADEEVGSVPYALILVLVLWPARTSSQLPCSNGLRDIEITSGGFVGIMNMHLNIDVLTLGDSPRIRNPLHKKRPITHPRLLPEKMGREYLDPEILLVERISAPSRLRAIRKHFASHLLGQQKQTHFS